MSGRRIARDEGPNPFDPRLFTTLPSTVYPTATHTKRVKRMFRHDRHVSRTEYRKLIELAKRWDQEDARAT